MKEDNRQKTERPQNKNLKRDAGPGRPKGQRNYATIYKEALLKLAEVNDTTADELEEGLIRMAHGKARKGDYNFYKDVQDRLHGKAKEVSYNINVDRDTLSEEQKEKLDNLLDNVE